MAFPCGNSKANDPIFVGGVGGPDVSQGSPELVGNIRARELKDALGLTTGQTWQIANIYIQEWVDKEWLGPLPSPEAFAPVRQRALDQVRALLTPEQRAQFNLLPLWSGGGLTTRSPWDQVDMLDKLVHLSPHEKALALRAYIETTEGLMEIPEAGRTSPLAVELHVATRNYIRTLLTPEQRRVWELTSQKKGGGLTVMSPADRLDRLDRVVHLTSDEKTTALEVYTVATEALMELPEGDRTAQRSEIIGGARMKIRTILTPEQQKIYDDVNAAQVRGS